MGRLDKYKDRYLGALAVLAIDSAVSMVSSVLVVMITRYIAQMEVMDFGTGILWTITGTVSGAVLFYLLKTYRIVIRHMGIKDISGFLWVALAKAAVLAGVAFAFSALAQYAAILALVDSLLTFGLLLMTRVAMVEVYDIVKKDSSKDKRKRILVCGTGDKSTSMVMRFENSPHYKVIGFLKSLDTYSQHTLCGKEIYPYSGSASLNVLKERLRLDAIIAPGQEYIRKHAKDLIEDTVNAGIKILVAPTVDETVNGVVLKNQIREVRIEDLLGREEIKVSMDTIIEYFKGKTVMVTGAAGSIGSELCRQLASFGIEKLILFDNAETPMHYLRLELEDKFKELKFVPVIGDVRINERLDYVFKKHRPQVVFHAAAYKHVPLMEENPCEAVRVNVIGSKNVADKCLEYGVERMVMISTDKAVNPTNVMGCSKRLAEIYVQTLSETVKDKPGCTRFVTTRFGNVLGSNGSVIPRFREQIANGGPVTVTHPDITRFFMTIPEACRLVMEAATLSDGNQIFVFDMGASHKIDDLARKMIRLSGLMPDVDIKIAYTGLRPGEKLYEEVLSKAEDTMATTHERIRIAKVREYNFKDVCDGIADLDRLSAEVKIDDLVRKMKEIVPEYRSNNSRFSIFDKDTPKALDAETEPHNVENRTVPEA